MKKIEKKLDPDECIHCGLCTKHCVFLQKYHIDVGQMIQRKDLAYHCFLCGQCSEICPRGIDGREIILQMRRNVVEENGGHVAEQGYSMLLWEKEDYRFRNYRCAYSKSVLFPGCNFLSFYPQTTKYLAELLWNKGKIGTVLDCCGKPVAELGMEKKEKEILDKLDNRMENLGIEEIIMICPNCYHFLKGKIHPRVVTIYEKLAELGIGCAIPEKIPVYLPCPDRRSKKVLEQAAEFLPEGVSIIEGIQCCGLGGCAGIKEPDLAAGLPGISDKNADIYTYCASCCGNLTRKGYRNAEHILIRILGMNERPDIKNSLWNRVKGKFYKLKMNDKMENMS